MGFDIWRTGYSRQPQQLSQRLAHLNLVGPADRAAAAAAVDDKKVQRLESLTARLLERKKSGMFEFFSLEALLFF